MKPAFLTAISKSIALSLTSEFFSSTIPSNAAFASLNKLLKSPILEFFLLSIILAIPTTIIGIININAKLSIGNIQISEFIFN